jgi:prolyl oligopeptidase
MTIEPPPTRVEAIVDIVHGEPVPDPYRWLEDGDSREVLDWTEAQAAYTRARLDAPAYRPALKERLRALFGLGIVTPPAVFGGRYFHQQRTGTEEQPRLLVRETVDGPDRVLLDPVLFSDRTSALDWFHPSEDGRLLAFGISEGGSERSTLRVRDVATGLDLEDVIPWTRACSIAWEPDARGFFYTRYPEPGTVPEGEEHYHRHVFHHALGADWRHDPLIFGADRPPQDWPNVQLSPDGRWLVITVSRGWSRTDVYLRDRKHDAGFVTVSEGEEALFGAIVRNDALYLHTNQGAPRYRLLRADLQQPGPESWREILPEEPSVLEGVLAVRGHLVAAWLQDASSRLSVHGMDGARLCEVPLPEIGSAASLTGAWDGDEAFFGFSSYTVPPTVYRLLPASGRLSRWAAVEGGFDAARFRVRLAHYASHDGTRVSVFLVDARDRPRDGRGPGVLTGYGGFNVSHTPAFGRSLLAFLEQGGLYAVAHLRGGGEYGEDWHRAGMLSRKQNVFDDFVAAAEYLVQEGHVAPERLGILGGSNGGLLVGAALTQRPELFRGVVCQVPLLDMVRYHLFRIARLWIPEYGSADDVDAFHWLYAYSPYHRVRDGVPYPAVLLTTGESDSRVDPLHARKMAARLQNATSSPHPVLLRVESRAGHGQGKPISKVLEEWTDVWTFFFEELGMHPQALD